MFLPFQHCGAMRWSGESIVSSTQQTLQFSNCFQKWRYLLLFLSDTALLLQGVLPSSGIRCRWFWQNIRQFNCALSMVSATARLASRGLEPPSFNSTVTLQGRIFVQMGAFMPAAQVRPAFYQYISLILTTTLRHNSGLEGWENWMLAWCSNSQGYWIKWISICERFEVSESGR